MAEPVRASGAVPTAPNSAMNGNGANGQPRSLFDAIDPSTANTANANGSATANGKSDKNKTTDMKTEGVKPLTALGPVLGILGIVIGLVVWNTNHTLAIVIGLIGLAILILWWLARRARKRAEATKGKKKPAGRAPSRQHNQNGYQRSPFGWLSRRGRHTYGSHGAHGAHRAHRAHSGSHGNNGHSSNPWWRRVRRNPLNLDRRRSRNGSESDGHGRSRNSRSSHTGDGHSRRGRRSLWPFGRNRNRRRSRGDHDGHYDGSGRRSRSHDTYGSRSGRSWRHPFGGGRSRHRSHNGNGRTPRSSGSHDGYGSHGGNHSGSGGSNRRRRWYKPWTWRNRSHDSGRNGGHGNPHGSDGHGDSGTDSHGDPRRRRFRNSFRRFWRWQLYDPSEESVNGYHDPNRRNWFKDRWSGWRTRRQRENINYAGFEVDSDGQAKPHYSRWRGWKRNVSDWRHWKWYWSQPKGWRQSGDYGNKTSYGRPVHADATRMDQTLTPDPTGPTIGGHSLSLGSGSGIPAQSFTQSATSATQPVPTTAPVTTNGGGTMAHSGGIQDTNARPAEASAYEMGAGHVHRSAVDNIQRWSRLSHQARVMAQSSNPFYRAAAQVLMRAAGIAHEAAQNDAATAAAMMNASHNAANGQRSIGR